MQQQCGQYRLCGSHQKIPIIEEGGNGFVKPKQDLSALPAGVTHELTRRQYLGLL